MNHRQLSEPLTNCRVACFSDTFGVDSNNGVGRFLQDLRSLSTANDLPIHFFAPGKGDGDTDVRFVRAPSFSVPGYPDLRISMPLEHQRKQIAHELKQLKPDVIHVSTPGPMGCLGVSLAKEMRLPLVGIYHTDFPGYAASIVASQLEHYQANPAKLLEHPFVKAVSPLVTDKATPLVMKLMMGNPDLMKDFATLSDIAMRNGKVFAGDVKWSEMICHLASRLTAKSLQQFYRNFTTVVARSPAQTLRISESLHLDKSQIRCLNPGIDTERFHPRHSSEKTWNQFPEVDPGCFKVLYVGRVTAEKNFDFLLETWSQVQQNRSINDANIQLLVVGRGDEALTRKASESPNVKLLGALGGEQLSAVYASSDLLVFPSVTETLGQVGLEGGASGLPVIVSDQGGPSLYVTSETGFILPADDPRQWANKILEVARDNKLAASLSRAARKHISKHHSFDASLVSYWNIHFDATELYRQQRAMKLRRKRQAIAAAELEPPSTAKGVMVITDYHAGKRFGNKLNRAQKRSAITAMLGKAVDENLEIIYGGDFGDHGSRPTRLEADFEMLRDVHNEVGIDNAPLLIRGNHDYGFTDAQLTELTGGCKVHESLFYFHEESRVAITHGHILGLHRVAELASESNIDAVSLEASLREDVLDEELKPSVIAYDLANLVESVTQKKGLTGLSNFWEAGFGIRSALAAHFLKLEQHASRIDMRTWKLIASLIGTHNDMQIAAQLGEACGSWATVYGHSHEPSTKNIMIGEHIHLVANAGNIHRKSPTCVVARFPAVEVWRFSHRDAALRVRDRKVLKNGNLKRQKKRMAIEARA